MITSPGDSSCSQKSDKAFTADCNNHWRFCFIFAAAILQQSKPSMISMAGGMPNVNTFPIESASFKLRYFTQELASLKIQTLFLKVHASV